MATQILATKLYKPVVRPGAVLRPRLIDRLNAGLSGKLTLVSAPAGFGKTTLITEWIAADERPSAWLSLNESDSVLPRFLTYLVAALQTIEPQIGAGILKRLESPQSLPIDSLLTPLLNEITTFSQDFVLVLDDYHVLDSPEIDTALAFLLDNQPPQMQLVITTREDPHLPLARLRARGQLTELRAVDLRFTPDETAEFLNNTMGLHLSPEDIAALELHTEGWVASLQMAAISMQGQDDKKQFIDAFTGSHRYIMDYLLEEVLSQQAADVRQFLLLTSILDRLNADLCDAVTGQSGSQAILEQLERRNLFVVALDHSRDWFRYHHLFADVLQARLHHDLPQMLSEVHRRAAQWYEKQDYSGAALRRAAQWYEKHDYPEAALRHAFLAEDYPLAARLLELAWPEMAVSYQLETWFKWARQLPEDIICERPVMCLDYAWLLISQGNPTESEHYLQEAEKYLWDDQNTFIVYDEEQFNNMPATIASSRAYIAMVRGQVEQTIHYAKESLALSTDPAQTSHRRARTLLGFASWASGDLQSADMALENHLLGLQHLGSAIIAYLGDLRIQLGRLHDAHRVYQEALALLDDDFKPLGVEELYRGLAELHLEWGNLDDARKYLDLSKSLGDYMAIPVWQRRYYVTEAQYHALLGEYDIALEQLDLAETHYLQTAMPDMHPTSTQKARILLKQGRLDEVEHWAKQPDGATTDPLHYLKEYDHITLAQLYMAQYRHDNHSVYYKKASTLLAQLLSEAETGSRLRSVIEILILQAELAALSDDLEAALRILDQALDLAEPQGYAYLFIIEGDDAKSLLQRSNHKYAKRLLADFPDASIRIEANPQAGLLDALSERELEVLRLVGEGLSNREIGERLFLALDTIKGHNRRIYDKLGVSRRTEAIARANELGLL